MKKFIIALSVATLTVSAFAMSKTPADDSACGADKACAVKEAAACCTTDGSCKTEKAVTCAKKAEADAKKAVEEKAECVGGVCPLKK
jgi:hypothetical protein